MAWIKRNLVFVVSLAVALVLLGVGIWFLLSQNTAANDVAAELHNSATRLDELVTRKPYPSEENIQLAKEEQARLLVFKTNLLARFALQRSFEKLDVSQFKELLESMIHELERDAERNGVKIPAKYGFTFADARTRLELDEKKLPALAGQVLDIKDICKIIFDAKIHELVHVKRTPTLKDEIAGSEFTSRKIVADAASGMSGFPYEVAFNCFTTELAAALAGLVNSPLMIITKTINLERADSAAPSDAAPTPMPFMMPGMPSGMDPRIMQRYGLNPYMRMQQQAAQAQPTTSNPLRGALLDEKSLRVTLGMDVVRLTPKAPPGEKPPARPKPPTAPGAPGAPGAPEEPAATPAPNN